MFMLGNKQLQQLREGETLDELAHRLQHGEDSHVLGVDLGQASDYTAICLVRSNAAPQGKRVHDLIHLERCPLGTPYPAIVERIKEFCNDQRLKWNSYLTVDATGVGRPVVDMLKVEGLKPYAINITGGNSVTHSGGFHGVPKVELVTNAVALLQSARLRIAQGLPLLDVLTHELTNFKVKVSLAGNATFEAWREKDHDDLVLAVALAVWYAERRREYRAVFYDGSGEPYMRV